MERRNRYFSVALLFAALALVSAPTAAHDHGDERRMTCDDSWHGGDRASFCEIREQTLPAPAGTLTVDGGLNGGIRVIGWDRKEVLVRTRVQAAGDTVEQARDLASQVRVVAAGGDVRAEGPDGRRGSWWSTSFEVYVPAKSSLSLKTHNGGVGISDVDGNVEFEVLNGGVSLRRMAGSVTGHTTNGGLHVELPDGRWDGEGLDVRTTNGGLSIVIPDGFSGRIETGTVHGGLHSDFPITMQGRNNKDLALDLGSGGPTMRIRTTNGGVSLKRSGQ